VARTPVRLAACRPSSLPERLAFFTPLAACTSSPQIGLAFFTWPVGLATVIDALASSPYRGLTSSPPVLASPRHPGRHILATVSSSSHRPHVHHPAGAVLTTVCHVLVTARPRDPTVLATVLARHRASLTLSPATHVSILSILFLAGG
jgi:hypothetical protein